MTRHAQIAASVSVFILVLALAISKFPVLGFFFTLLCVYLVTTATMDAIADQRCGCATLRRIAIRFSLRTLLLATTLLAVMFGLAAWATS